MEPRQEGERWGSKRVAVRVSPIYKPASWLLERSRSFKFESWPSSTGMEPDKREKHGV
jgi:hypothetical protein